MQALKLLFGQTKLYQISAIIVYIVATFLFLSPVDPDGVGLFPHFDKVAHCIVFFSLASLTEFSLNHKAKLIITSLICYGAAIEILQGQFFGRTASFFDLIADVSGIFLFYFLLTKTKLSCFRSWVAAQSAH